MATQTLKNVILQLRTGSATQWAASPESWPWANPAWRPTLDESR